MGQTGCDDDWAERGFREEGGGEVPIGSRMSARGHHRGRRAGGGPHAEKRKKALSGPLRGGRVEMAHGGGGGCVEGREVVGSGGVVRRRL